MKPQKILVLNCGSSSIKFQLFCMTDERSLAKGLIEKIGSDEAMIHYMTSNENDIHRMQSVPNHDTGIELVLSLLMHPGHGVIQDKSSISGIGQRVVHGGEEFSDSVLCDSVVKSAIRRYSQFAPLHNPHNLEGIVSCEKLLPGVPQVAVFDTAFHHTLPEHAYLYGLPYGLYTKLGIRRYGFHGTSHRFVAQRAAEILNQRLEDLKLITCHLGNGASVAAIDGGKSVDTSMGFTPLEGLVMGTRCGDMDPAIIPYIMEHEDLTSKQMDTVMNSYSGMLGLTGTSNDLREIVADAKRGSERHEMALKVYCYRIRKYIGAYMTVLGRVDAIVFTGGVGEHRPEVRSCSLEGLEHFGIEIHNESNASNEIRISTGKVHVLVIPTNEELAIARDTCKILSFKFQESNNK